MGGGNEELLEDQRRSQIEGKGDQVGQRIARENALVVRDQHMKFRLTRRTESALEQISLSDGKPIPIPFELSEPMHQAEQLRHIVGNCRPMITAFPCCC